MGRRVVSDEEKAEIIKLYNEKYSIAEIRRRTGASRKYIDNLISELVDGNYIKKRDKLKSREKAEKIERRKRIEQMYLAGIKQKEIAEILHLSLRTVNKQIVEMKNDGMLQPRKVHREVPKAVYEAVAKCEVPSTLKPGQTVYCDEKIAKTCVYGSIETKGLCNYCSITGKCRSVGKDGCSYTACTKYSKVSANNPKLIPRGE